MKLISFADTLTTTLPIGHKQITLRDWKRSTTILYPSLPMIHNQLSKGDLNYLKYLFMSNDGVYEIGHLYYLDDQNNKF